MLFNNFLFYGEGPTLVQATFPDGERRLAWRRTDLISEGEMGMSGVAATVYLDAVMGERNGMKNRTHQHFLSWLLAAVPILAAPASVRGALRSQPQEITCAVEYTVQAQDWLSKLAAKYLGDVWAYPAIVQATNQKHTIDQRFAQITNPDLIEVGWLVCVPDAITASTLLAEQAVAMPTPQPVVWQPLPRAECEELAGALAQQLSVSMEITTTAFYGGPLIAPNSTGCQITTTASNQVFQAADGMDILNEVERVLAARGWSLDWESVFGAEAFSYVTGEFNKDQAQCQLAVQGHASGHVECPEGLSHASCFYELPPEQQEYTIWLTCAQMTQL